MDTIRERLASFPRLRNSLLPTPVHRLDHLSDEYGVDVYCKRDDLTGFGFGGNKTRKLDFLLAHAQSLGCDTLIGIGVICGLATLKDALINELYDLADAINAITCPP